MSKKYATYEDGSPVRVHGQSVVIGAIAGVLITVAISSFVTYRLLMDYACIGAG